MNIGIRMHDTRPGDLESQIANIRQDGFSCVHMALSKSIHNHSVANGALTPGMAMHLKRLFAKQELDVAVLGCYLNLAHPNDKTLMQIQATYEAHLRFAALLGAGVVGTETGAPNEQYRYEPACHSQDSLDLFIRNLAPVVATAEKLGTIIAIEPVFSHIVSNPQRAKEVLRRIASPNLRIIFDPVNMLDISNYQEQERIVYEAIDLLGDEIVVLHAKDFLVTENGLKSVAAGLGQLDYRPILAFVAAQKPFMHITLEDTVPENAVAARKYLQTLDYKTAIKSL